MCPKSLRASGRLSLGRLFGISLNFVNYEVCSVKAGQFYSSIFVRDPNEQL